MQQQRKRKRGAGMSDAGESHVWGQVLERTSTLILEIADSVVIVLDVEIL